MIATATEAGVRTVTLDRPDRRNALTPEGLDALRGAVTDADAPVVYIHGAGSAFCAGADLSVVEALSPEKAEAFARHGQAVADAIAKADSVVVAGVDGAARGGGVELALACDLRIATPAATLAESGIERGLFGAWGGTTRLPDVVGRGVAMDMALTGRTLDAEEALRVGLVSQVRAEPRAVAERIARHDPRTLNRVAGLLRQTAPRSTQHRREAAAFRECVARRTREDGS